MSFLIHRRFCNQLWLRMAQSDHLPEECAQQRPLLRVKWHVTFRDQISISQQKGGYFQLQQFHSFSKKYSFQRMKMLMEKKSLAPHLKHYLLKFLKESINFPELTRQKTATIKARKKKTLTRPTAARQFPEFTDACLIIDPCSCSPALSSPFGFLCPVATVSSSHLAPVPPSFGAAGAPLLVPWVRRRLCCTHWASPTAFLMVAHHQRSSSEDKYICLAPRPIFFFKYLK